MEQIFDISILALKILSCIYRAEERYGVYIIASTLCGKSNKKTQELGLDKLSTYGIVNYLSRQQVIAVIHYLMHVGLIFRSVEHNNLKLSSLGKQFLKNKPALCIPQKIIDDARTLQFSRKLLQTHLETLSLWYQEKTIGEIAIQRNLKEATIEGHIADLINHKKIESIREFMSEDTEKLIKTVLEKNPDAKLKEIKTQLPENVSYGQIKIVLAFQQRGKFES